LADIQEVKIALPSSLAEFNRQLMQQISGTYPRTAMFQGEATQDHMTMIVFWSEDFLTTQQKQTLLNWINVWQDSVEAEEGSRPNVFYTINTAEGGKIS
jgi:hypothetical protein